MIQMIDRHAVQEMFKSGTSTRAVALHYGVTRRTIQRIVKEPPDEVAIQAFTCIAVPLPILALGAKPVYVDINPDDLGMDVEDLRRKIGPKTRVVVIQHTFGIPANAPVLAAVAAEVGAVVIEDCCHGLDAAIGDRHVGTFGAGAFYSFEWGKPLVAGVGGGIVVDDLEVRGDLKRRAREFTKAPLTQRLLLEAQFWAFRTLLTGRSYSIRTLYNRLSSAGLLVGTFGSEDELATPDIDEYRFAIAPGTTRRLAIKLSKVADIVTHQRKLTSYYTDRLAEHYLPVWPVPTGRAPTFMRYPFVARDKEMLLKRAREARIELSGYSRPLSTRLRAPRRRPWDTAQARVRGGRGGAAGRLGPYRAPDLQSGGGSNGGIPPCAPRSACGPCAPRRGTVSVPEDALESSRAGARVDAHAEYPEEYVRLCVENLLAHEVENVGGFRKTLPRSKGLAAEAIAQSIVSRFGSGEAVLRSRGYGRRTHLPPDSVDFHISFTVLEHIPPDDLRNILKEGQRIVKPGGLLVHRIDYTEHFQHSDPSVVLINFLQYSEAAWQRLAGNRYMYMNRLRHDDMMELIHELGQRVVRVRVDNDPALEAVLRSEKFDLHRRFASKSAAVLTTTGAWIVTSPE